MSSILVYDPCPHHKELRNQSGVDLFTDLKLLIQSLKNYPQRRRIVVVCGDHKSYAINALTSEADRQVLKIYPCADHHCSPEENPLYHPKVQEPKSITGRSDWDFTFRVDLLAEDVKYGASSQHADERPRLQSIIDQPRMTYPESIAVVDRKDDTKCEQARK